MSWTALLESVPSCSEGDSDRPPLGWLLAMLKQAMETAMASEAKPLQKANAIARLGNLYLKAYGAAGLARENKALKRRVAELEEELQRERGCGAAPSAPRGVGSPPASEVVAATIPEPINSRRAPAPSAAKTSAALSVGRAPGRRSSAGGRQPKSGQRARPRRP